MRIKNNQWQDGVVKSRFLFMLQSIVKGYFMHSQL